MRRKAFSAVDLSIPEVVTVDDAAIGKVIPLECIPPLITRVTFPRSAQTTRSFDFKSWYGAGIDAICYACQRQIERFLAKQDSQVEASTVSSYCRSGLRHFLDYMVLRAAALGRDLSLRDIDRAAIDGFLRFLRDLGTATTSQRVNYKTTKAVLVALGRRGLLRITTDGDSATFPANPFPNANAKAKPEKPLTRKERKDFAAAVKTAVMPIFGPASEVTADVLAFALLVIALHTGRNLTPLLEMGPDCLRSHPKDHTSFLVLYKRRGNSCSKVALRRDQPEAGIESMPRVQTNVVRIIRRAMELSADLRSEAADDIRNRVWLYRSRALDTSGEVTTLSAGVVYAAVARLVADYKLLGSDGKPMRINVARLRKTFGNRIFELTDGDLATTATALGNTVPVAGRNYMAVGEDSAKNWMFMGRALVSELLSGTIGATEKTPVGQCSDPIQGQYAPKSGTTCFSFLDCLRCRNYVVTGDDLYRLFSFYWRALAERDRLSKDQWSRHYAHIPRLIDRDIIAPAVANKIFSQKAVDEAKQRARTDPHPFWTVGLLPALEELR